MEETRQKVFNMMQKMAESSSSFSFRVLMVGDEAVGKTCILDRYIYDRFSDGTPPTICADSKLAYTRSGENVMKLSIWDTSGQKRFRSMVLHYFTSIQGVIVVYDMTNRESLYNVREWIEIISKKCASSIPICVVGNKCDSPVEERIPPEEISSFMDEINFANRHFEVSALTGEGIQGAFQMLALAMLGDEVSKQESGGHESDSSEDKPETACGRFLKFRSPTFRCNLC